MAKELENLEIEKKRLSESLTDISQGHDKLSVQGEKLEELIVRIEEKTSRWLELSEIV